MPKWAKLHERISASQQIADAYAANRDAPLLFMLMLPHADVYGILPGDARILRGRVCPLLPLTPKRIQAALESLHSVGLIVLYRDSEGKQLVWIRKWLDFQDVRWSRVGPPEYELPDDWEPPEELVQFAAKNPDKPLSRWFKRWSSRQLQDTPGVSEQLPETPPTVTVTDREPGGGPRTVGCYVTSTEPPAPDQNDPPPESPQESTDPPDYVELAMRLLSWPEDEITPQAQAAVSNALTGYSEQAVYQAALETQAAFSDQPGASWARKAKFFARAVSYVGSRGESARPRGREPPRGPLPPMTPDDWRELRKRGGLESVLERATRGKPERKPVGDGADPLPKAKRLQVGDRAGG